MSFLPQPVCTALPLVHERRAMTGIGASSHYRERIISTQNRRPSTFVSVLEQWRWRRGGTLTSPGMSNQSLYMSVRVIPCSNPQLPQAPCSPRQILCSNLATRFRMIVAGCTMLRSCSQCTAANLCSYTLRHLSTYLAFQSNGRLITCKSGTELRMRALDTTIRPAKAVWNSSFQILPILIFP